VQKDRQIVNLHGMQRFVLFDAAAIWLSRNLAASYADTLSPQAVYYCSADHQKSDWKNHKNTCKHVQQANKTVRISFTPGIAS
jgi:hypothetical protein